MWSVLHISLTHEAICVALFIPVENDTSPSLAKVFVYTVHDSRNKKTK